MEKRLKMPRPQIWYGEVIYWFSIVAAIICMIGPLIAMLSVDNNFTNPHYLFKAIFEGKNAEAIWQEGGGFPGGHFYLHNFTRGDGFTQFGLALGCSCALPALIVAAIGYVSDRAYGYVLMSLWVAFLVAFAATR